MTGDGAWAGTNPQLSALQNTGNIELVASASQLVGTALTQSGGGTTASIDAVVEAGQTYQLQVKGHSTSTNVHLYAQGLCTSQGLCLQTQGDVFGAALTATSATFIMIFKAATAATTTKIGVGFVGATEAGDAFTIQTLSLTPLGVFSASTLSNLLPAKVDKYVDAFQIANLQSAIFTAHVTRLLPRPVVLPAGLMQLRRKHLVQSASMRGDLTLLQCCAGPISLLVGPLLVDAVSQADATIYKETRNSAPRAASLLSSKKLSMNLLLDVWCATDTNCISKFEHTESQIINGISVDTVLLKASIAQPAAGWQAAQWQTVQSTAGVTIVGNQGTQSCPVNTKSAL